MSEVKNEIKVEIDEGYLNLKEWNWDADDLLEPVIRSISENAFRVIVDQIKKDFKCAFLKSDGEITLSFLDGLFVKIHLEVLVDNAIEEESNLPVLAAIFRRLADKIDHVAGG